MVFHLLEGWLDVFGGQSLWTDQITQATKKAKAQTAANNNIIFYYDDEVIIVWKIKLTQKNVQQFIKRDYLGSTLLQ